MSVVREDVIRPFCLYLYFFAFLVLWFCQRRGSDSVLIKSFPWFATPLARWEG
ncbi:hypothetical protein BDV32DRAFT_131525, partial [Aspergillus pseudonomiae]